MEKIPRLSPEQRENLVAYLDGELPETASKEIDQVLLKSPAVQHDVDMLSRTWDLLDQLPRLTGTGHLTQRTLTAVRQDEAPKPLVPAWWKDRLPREQLRRGGIVVAWVAALALSAVAGFLVTNRMIPGTSDELLVNLPVIEKLDSYANVESVEFLRELEKRIGSFDDARSRKP